MTNWTKALRKLIEEALSDFIIQHNISICENETISPNPDASRQVYGGVTLVRGEIEIRFYIEVIDAYSSCGIYKSNRHIAEVSQLIEEAISKDIMDIILKKIGARYKDENYGFLLAQSRLYCDVLADRLGPVFSDSIFDPEAAIRKPGLIAESRIAHWTS